MAACAPAPGYFTPPPSTTTLTPGWERWFTLDWTVTPEDNGSRRLEGYVNSRHGEYAQSVRVLARAVDSQGRELGEEIGWIPGGIGGFGRGSFVIARLPTADRYVVSVWTTPFSGNPVAKPVSSPDGSGLRVPHVAGFA